MIFVDDNKLRLYFCHAVLGLVLSFLTGCAEFNPDDLTPLQKIRMEWAYAQADSLLDDAEYTKAAKILADAAWDLPSPPRDRMQIKSAQILAEGNFLLKAFQQLKRVDETALSPSELLEKRILDARFYRQANRPEKVLQSLPPAIIGAEDKEAQILSFAMRADAALATRDYIGSVEARIRLDPLLSDDEADENITALWHALVAESPEKIEDRIRRDDAGRALDAWLELARLATPRQVRRDVLERRYADWKERNAFLNSPASLLTFLRLRWDYLDFNPRRVSLLLPLTGDYVRAGKVIRDGFMRAYDQAESPPEIKIYNTDQAKSITELYRQAIAEGTDLVIGPLLKAKVDELIAGTEFSVPTIVLNYHSQKHIKPRGELFQFGLLPEDDAAQVAQKMIEKGHVFGMVLAPDSEWGARMERAFVEEYQKQGGEIRDIFRYDPNFSDYSAFVQSGLRLDESRRRHRRAEETAERKLRFTPRIRDDITAAAMFSNYENGVLIYPLLKFHYAHDLSVFSTSHIYEPQKSKLLRELDGMVYCDIPAVIDGIEETFENNSHLRLFALGADAYRLSRLIRRIALGNTSFDGMTGRITLHSKRRLFRNLSWARFERGQPVSLGRGW